MRKFFSKIQTSLPSIVAALLVVAVFLTGALSVHASSYGEGSYGSGKYGEGEVTTSTSDTVSSPVCNDTQPASSPWLYGASARSSNSVLLQFTEAEDPVDEYVVEYGTESGNYQFAMASIGGKGTTSYLVQALSPNTTYFFRVRAGNGCATGEWSNELSAKTLSGYTFTEGTDKLETEIIDTELKKKEEEEEPEEDDETAEEQVLGVNVRIKVVDQDKEPVPGAEVTLYSTPRKSKTNEEGIALFEDVEPGEHRVVIAHHGQTGEQRINVPEDPETEDIDFTIQIKPVSPFRDPSVMLVVGGLSLVLLGAFVVILKR